MTREEFYANARGDRTGPLDGVLVIEATTTWAGPMAACVLADYGATVIKVEHPEGEVGRRLPPFFPGSELTVFYETVNRNKQSLSLDLRQGEGRDIFLSLCAAADIVVENFRPGTMAKWGVGYRDVAAVKPDIIYVSVSGFGQFGELSGRVGYDPMAQNYCGWSSLNGEPDGDPVKAPTFLADDLGGLNGAMGAMAALHHRDQTGEGQHVDVALVDGLIFQSNGNLTTGALGLPIARMGNEFSLAAPVNSFACVDGRVYAGVLLDGHWKSLTGLLERPDLTDLSAPERIGRRDEVNEVVGAWCATRTTAEVVDSFSELGLPATRVNTFEECSKLDHVASRDMLQETELSDGSMAPLTGPAAKFSRTPTRVRAGAAPLGAHNEEILRRLGYDDEGIRRLKRDGITS
ncbi:MAG TPA: CoA transferase [Gammaproteobacteria bacterium]|jgi:crotonobetainyl-CoA:carnitine CoA-transferase CaiB-like acyl-CoA transferase|nr:CoA transferase [Gammaproteobacteria bacterium]